MYEKVLYEMRARVRLGRMAISIHTLDEMRDDELIPDDLKNCILTGRIVERQFDEDYAENKYVIEGATLNPSEFIHVVAKLGRKNTVVITAYRVW
jgi:hypothetical protein